MSENNASDTPRNARLYIGNLPFSVDGGYLKKFFQELLGEEAVQDAEVIVDKARGRSKGYGFVTFTSSEFAEKATSFNGKEMSSKDGSSRPISINPAHDKKMNDDRGGFRPNNRFQNNDSRGGGRGYYGNNSNNDRGGNRKRNNYGSNRGNSRNPRGRYSDNERDYQYS
ncbi:MAG: RNA-binding protein [Candidatus Caenarcaniphilales bacterium]|nr:RNA-binding protein [Candidatus Caenarcaniphilales bacterium]